MLISKVRVFIQVKLVAMACAPSEQKRNRGNRLIKKENFTAVLASSRAQPSGFGVEERVVSTGRVRSTKIIRRDEDISKGVAGIAFTWSCTKSLWFLRPTDGYYPLKARESTGIQPEVRGVAALVAGKPLSVNRRTLTPNFRITI